MFSGPEIDPQLWRKLFIHHLNLQMVSRLLKLLIKLEIDFSLVTLLSRESLTTIARLLSIHAIPKGTNELLRAVEIAIIENLEAVNNAGEIKSVVSSALGEAFNHLISVIKQSDRLSKIRFFYLIDEYENLTEDQQRVVNTLIKHCAPNYFIKLGIRDYGIWTNLTLSDDEYLAHPADYVRISIMDRFPEGDYRDFALRVVTCRLAALDARLDLEKVFESYTISEEFEACCPPARRTELEEFGTGLPSHARDRGLLFLAFLNGYLPHNNIPIHELPRPQDTAYQKIEDAFGNYSFAIVLNELRSLKTPLKKRYSGINLLIDLSGKNIRYFMELIFRSFVAELERGGRIDLISPDAQTSSVLEVGELYLREIEFRGLTGQSVKRLVSSLGSVFEGLSRDVFRGRVETTQFVINQDDSTPNDVERAESLVRNAVMHGGLLEAPRTKAEAPGDAKIREYRIFPLFCPFLGCSHRKKRQIALHSREISLMGTDPVEGAKLVIKRLTKRRRDRQDSQEELF